MYERRYIIMLAAVFDYGSGIWYLWKYMYIFYNMKVESKMISKWRELLLIISPNYDWSKLKSKTKSKDNIIISYLYNSKKNKFTYGKYISEKKSFKLCESINKSVKLNNILFW